MASSGEGSSPGPGGGLDPNLATIARLARCRSLAQYFRMLPAEMRLKIYKGIMPTNSSLAIKTYFINKGSVGYFDGAPGEFITVGDPDFVAECLYEIVQSFGTLRWRAHSAFELKWQNEWLSSRQTLVPWVKNLEVLNTANEPPELATTTSSASTSGQPTHNTMEDAFVALIGTLTHLEHVRIHTGSGGVLEWWTASGAAVNASDNPNDAQAVAGWAKLRMVVIALSRVATLKKLVLHGEFIQETDVNLPASYPHRKCAKRAADILQAMGRKDIQVEARYSMGDVNGIFAGDMLMESWGN